MKQNSKFNFLRFYVETRYAIGFSECPIRGFGAQPIPKFLQKVAKYYGISIERDSRLGYEQAVHLVWSPSNLGQIVLGDFIDEERELLAFFHELGHELAKRLTVKHRYLNKQAVEGIAWELGLDAAYRFGFEWEEGDPALQWAINCFNSYYVDPSSS